MCITPTILLTLAIYSGQSAARMQHTTNRMQAAVHLSGYGLYAGDGAQEHSEGVGVGVEKHKQTVSLHFDLGPEDDVGLKVTEACEGHGLSDEGCDTVMQQVGLRFSDYQGSTRAQLASMPFSQAFARLMGMRPREGSTGGQWPLETFAEVSEAAYSSDHFRDIAAWWRYQEMVGEAMEENVDYQHFARSTKLTVLEGFQPADHSYTDYTS